MQAHRIDQVGNKSISETHVGTERLQQRRVALHDRSAFDNKTNGGQDLSSLDPEKKKAQDAVVADILSQKPRSMDVRGPDGVITVPLMSDADQNAVQRVFSRLSPEKRDEVSRMAKRLGRALLDEAGDSTESYSAGLNGLANETFSTYLLSAGSDQNTQNQKDCMYVGMIGIESQLYEFADNLRDKQIVAEDVRTDLGVLDQMLADWPDDGSTQSFTYHKITLNDDGTVTVEEKTVELNKQQAQGLRQSLQLDLDSLSSITQMDATKLEQMVNRYQQAMTTLSNIIKNQDESLRGVAQNVKA